VAHSLLVNPVIRQLIGEARAASGPGGIAFIPPEPHPDDAPTAMQAVTGQTHAAEEKEEVHIGKEILYNTHLLPPLARRDATIQNIERLANRLIQMHQRS
jgi:hypothetical protein